MYQVTGWEKTLGSSSSRTMSILAHPWCFSSCFSNSSLWHCQTSPVLLLLFSKLASCSHPLTASRSWDHLLPNSAVPIPPGDPHPPTKVSHRSSELSQVTAPMEIITEPVQTAFPFPAQISGNRSLPTFGHLAWYEAEEASRSLSLHSELLFFNANCCLGICIWNGFAFPQLWCHPLGSRETLGFHRSIWGTSLSLSPLLVSPRCADLETPHWNGAAALGTAKSHPQQANPSPHKPVEKRPVLAHSVLQSLVFSLWFHDLEAAIKPFCFLKVILEQLVIQQGSASMEHYILQEEWHSVDDQTIKNLLFLEAEHHEHKEEMKDDALGLLHIKCFLNFLKFRKF